MESIYNDVAKNELLFATFKQLFPFSVSVSHRKGN